MLFGKWNWILLLINLVITAVLFFLSDQQSLLSLINSIFYVAFFYFIVGMLLFVIKGRVLDGITRSFRRFGKVMSKGLFDFEENGVPSEWVNRSFLSHMLFQAAVLIGLMLILLAIFYLF
ncbi:DUF3899 domain-containing protein [Terribacillus sp. 7520-G]|uniref:DUF3899 domain-containing protein n=1 Tax=Terribacillus TaxID=459532 RepID=UPI000BA59159|nr:DUF3899 domain-containing protein [Terribacillus sp. 7520-G]PAD38243.1 hypothetical protein CHH53_12195 [Terribacillus sp. 7520-G]